MAKYKWYDDNKKPNLPDRREACKDFLNWVLTNPDNVANLRDRLRKETGYAHTMFREKGNIDIPDGVEVTCFDRSTDADNLDRVVDIILPDEGSMVLKSSQEIFDYWTFGWPPYNPKINKISLTERK